MACSRRVRRGLKHPACFVKVPPGLEVSPCASAPPQPAGLSRSSPGFQSRATLARFSQPYVPRLRPGRSHRVRRVLKDPAVFVKVPSGLEIARCASAPPQPAGLPRSSPGFQSRAASARSSQPYVPRPRPGAISQSPPGVETPGYSVKVPSGLRGAPFVIAPSQPTGLSRSSPGFQSRAAPARSSQPCVTRIQPVRGFGGIGTISLPRTHARREVVGCSDRTRAAGC